MSEANATNAKIRAHSLLAPAPQIPQEIMTSLASLRSARWSAADHKIYEIDRKPEEAGEHIVPAPAWKVLLAPAVLLGGSLIAAQAGMFWLLLLG